MALGTHAQAVEGRNLAQEYQRVCGPLPKLLIPEVNPDMECVFWVERVLEKFIIQRGTIAALAAKKVKAERARIAVQTAFKPGSKTGEVAP
jgi:hypothetical protein